MAPLAITRPREQDPDFWLRQVFILINSNSTNFDLLLKLFNQTVTLFGQQISNTPEIIIPGPITSKGRIAYRFRVFEGLTVVYTETKLEAETVKEHLDDVAQLIAKADGIYYLSIAVSNTALTYYNRMRLC